MAHSHEHHHEHVHELTSLNKSFIIGITLNILFVLVEFGIGFYYDSLGLLSDAGHNLGDVASLVLAMLAFRLAKVHPNSRYTYGYKKITAKCTVSKSGYTTRSVSSSKSLKSGFGGVETDWISGPTYKSSGTKFVSKHTGYSHDGIYSELKASKKY